MSAAPLTLLPVEGIGEVRPGTDLAGQVRAAADLRDGDVLVVTSKVVSKAEGRVVTGDKAAALAGETDRVVARRGATSIVRTRHGLVMANAGIDASNTETGTLVLLPTDPDGSARALREALAVVGNVAVLVTDTAGRAWRNGQTDIAVGAAGIDPLHDYAGRTDGYGNELAVTAPAVADEIAAAADLVKGKLAGVPAAVVRGLGHLVLPAGEHGPGAAALVRAESGDLFGLGARDAVLHAVHGTGQRGFGGPCPSAELAAVLRGLGAVVREEGAAVEAALPEATERETGRLEARLEAVGLAHGWAVAGPVGSDGVLRFVPGLTYTSR
ncbi:MAG: coenzyme F420-0:L-glutamate ligase [Nocardioidaceae bacterium]